MADKNENGTEDMSNHYDLTIREEDMLDLACMILEE